MFPHNFNINTEDRDSSFQQSSGEHKEKYNLNKVNVNFKDFFQTDLKLSGNENMKKEPEKDGNIEKKSEKGDNKFMNDIFEEIGDSGLNNNSSKASQRDSKIKNKSTNKSVSKNIKKNSIDNEVEEVGVNRDDNEVEEIESINDFKDNNNDANKNELEKKNMMENYLKEHPNKNKIDKNKFNIQNISEQSNEIEEKLNTNENLQKNNSRIKEDDDDYGGFDNINSETMNNQNIQTSSVAQSKKNKKNSTSSNMNKQNLNSDSYNKYMGEFDQSKLNEINKMEDNNKSNAVEKLINEVNNEHKKNTKKLENNNYNIYSNNNLNNVINSNNFINSVGSGDSYNVNNIIKKEIGKYDVNEPGFKKKEYNHNLQSLYGFTNLKKLNTEHFSIYRPFKKEGKGLEMLLKTKYENALKNQRDRNQILEKELDSMKNEYDKLLEEIKKLNQQKNNDLNELKAYYENSIKNQENMAIKREKQRNDILMKDMENKYQTDIVKKVNEIERLKNDYDYLENKYNILDNEYKKLKDSKENEDQLNNLRSENYHLHAQINEIKNKKNKVLDSIQKDKIINDEKNKSDTIKIYEQLLNEREINTQEKLLNNYLKEIKKLNEEIIFLKSVNSIKKNKNPENYVLSENVINNKINEPKMNNYIINPSLKESAENQIKKLQDFLLPSSDDPTNNKLILMEKEFSRLQNSESPNEITFSNYFKVMKQFKVPLTSNELMEIFNNFQRIKGDRIRMNDFINALNSKSPSTFFLQSDPSYLNELESRLIKSQNRVKELEKFILVNNNENEEFKTQLKKSMEENKLLTNKINELNSKILQYFLFREEKNMSNPDVIQMKEKMRTMEIKNKTMDSELNDKFVKYEKRIEDLQKTYEDQRINLLKEKDGYKEQINQLKNEKEKEKNEFDKKEIKFKTEIEKLNEKLEKYKKNYNILSNKNEMNKKEKEKILNSFKDKGLEPEQIIAFINNTSNIQEILNKINELEKKNLNREETYKKICMEVNKSQVNMELEKLKKKHDEEKRGLLKIIAQKNNELNSIKSEFFAIMNELEKLKANNKFK